MDRLLVTDTQHGAAIGSFLLLRAAVMDLVRVYYMRLADGGQAPLKILGAMEPAVEIDNVLAAWTVLQSQRGYVHSCLPLSRRHRAS